MGWLAKNMMVKILMHRDAGLLTPEVPISLQGGEGLKDGRSEKPHILTVITGAMIIFRDEENLLVEDMELT